MTGLTTPFSVMVPREDGAATYAIQAVMGKVKPGIQQPTLDEDPYPPINMVYYTQYQTLYSFPYHWTPTPGSAPVGFFTWREMTANAVVAGGHVTQSQIDAWFQSVPPSTAPLPVRDPSVATALPAGVDPSQGDPDDPTPPVLIVTQSPSVPGVTMKP